MTQTIQIPRPEDALEAAALCCGGAEMLTQQIGYTVQAYYMWRYRGSVPRRAALAIEAATRGQVKHEDILAQYSR